MKLLNGLNKIPIDVFWQEEFKEYPYRKIDFENQIIEKSLTIQELLRTEEEDLIHKVQEIGPLSFYYNFMKLTISDDSKYFESTRKLINWKD